MFESVTFATQLVKVLYLRQEVKILKKSRYEFYENSKFDSLVEIVERSAELYGDSIAFRYKKKKESFAKSYNDLLADSREFGKFLLSRGLEKGHIALLGASSYKWITAYIGVQLAGLTVIPLDKELDGEILKQQMEKSHADFLFYDKEYSDTADEILELLGKDFPHFCIDKDLPESTDGVFFPAVQPDKLAAILFTSGTTGKSKGVMLTQRNIANNVACGLGSLKYKPGEDVLMSVLPFNHALESTFTIFGGIYAGVTVCISRSLKYLQKDIKEYQPTIMIIVPLIAEKLYDKIWSTAKKKGKEEELKKGLAVSHFFNKIGIDVSHHILSEVREAFGGRLRIFICGGAPLKEDMITKYKDLGVNLYQGYGLTECAPLLTVNFDYYHRPGSVGKIVDTCCVKAVDGEIWAKGTTVSTGYYNDEERTRESFEDGWFKTGDLGYIDKDGFVFITGRKKNLIILSNGENVSAEELEDKVHTLSYVDEVIVYGKDDKIVAEIFPKEDIETPSEKDIYGDISKINKELAYYKHIDKVVLRDEPFPKTTTKKIIRKAEN